VDGIACAEPWLPPCRPASSAAPADELRHPVWVPALCQPPAACLCASDPDCPTRDASLL